MQLQLLQKYIQTCELKRKQRPIIYMCCFKRLKANSENKFRNEIKDDDRLYDSKLNKQQGHNDPRT